jgi:hypothetical protein
MRKPPLPPKKTPKYHYQKHGLKVTALELDKDLHADLKRIARDGFDRPLIWLLQHVLSAFRDSYLKGEETT